STLVVFAYILFVHFTFALKSLDFTITVLKQGKIMGRKAGTLFINPKKFGNLQKPCAREMISFLNCLALSQQGNDSKCSRQKSLLSTCMDAQSSGKRKPWGSINYHLQRLSRGRK
ncbi:replication and maintenance protein, partial [Striga asiatica]